MMQPIYEDVSPPPELGYGGGLAVRVRVNPTRAQWRDWSAGVSVTPDASALDRALCALYGQTTAAGLDFRTPEAARATIESDDVPDEIVMWLLLLPYTVISRRRDAIVKNASTLSATTS